MRVFKTILAGFVVLSLGATALQAQSLRRNTGPAEVPPSSYTGNQYIDSRGCVFIRSGYGGQVTWVPRVTRKRQVVCGQTPSRVAGTSATPAIRAQPQIQTFAAAPTPQTTAAVNTPRRRVQNNFWRNFWGTGRAQHTATASVTGVPTATIFTRRETATTRVATAVRPTQIPNDVASVIQFNLQSRHVVRTGPQAEHPSFYAINRPVGAGAPQANVVARVAVAGYRSVLADSQIASVRGVGTPQGQASMDLIWTNSVPRKLIDVTTGYDVSTQYPNILYPYTTVTTKSYRTVAAAAPVTTAAVAVAPVVLAKSTRQVEFVSATVDPEPVAVDSGVTKTLVPSRLRYVQVATFGVPANAVRTLAKFSATGLPTHSRPLHRKGKVYEIVLLGPFQDQTGLKAALSAARGAGFGDAFFVK